MITTSAKGYAEAYISSRKKILNDFLKDEENDTIRYISETEKLVNLTKKLLNDVIVGGFDAEKVLRSLDNIGRDLECENRALEGEIEKLERKNIEVEKSNKELDIQEKKSNENFLKKVDELKKELENKEFTIQNMEKLYVQLENIIKDNIAKKKEQLLSLEQFDEFVGQNDKLKKECKMLEAEKEKLVKEHALLLRSNLSLRARDESFEAERIRDVLEEVAALGGLRCEAEKRIQRLQLRCKELETESTSIRGRLGKVLFDLDALGIENWNMEGEIKIIKKELNDNENKVNKSFSEIYENEEWKDLPLPFKKRNKYINKKK